MNESRKWSFCVQVFYFLQSTHILNFPFSFFTNTIGETQSVIYTGFINPTFNNLSNSALTNNYNCGFILLTFYLIGLTPEIKGMRYSTQLTSILGASNWVPLQLTTFPAHRFLGTTNPVLVQLVMVWYNYKFNGLRSRSLSNGCT